jgi:murein DD-endopeptidase MepM/ murein hydrolase activator NlpD
MKLVIFTVILFTALIPIYGFQWPVADVVIVSTFGESEFKQFVKGIDIGGESQDIRPIDSGELVFYSSPGTSPLDIPSGLGTYVIYQHKNGIRSLYGHLEDGSVNIDQQKISLSDTIGIMGSSGSAVGTMLHLQVIDIDFEKYINPLLSLPLLIDGSKPIINEVYLINEEGKKAISSGEIINSGVFGLSADIRDISEDVAYYCPVSPFSISLFINGENLANINFESLKIKDDKMILQDLKGISHDELYRDEWEFYLGEFELNPGDVMIEISVKDFAGNEGVIIFPLKIME